MLTPVYQDWSGEEVSQVRGSGPKCNCGYLSADRYFLSHVVQPLIVFNPG